MVRGLRKPEFNPPNWIFAPIWNVLYVLMGVAAWMVWTERGRNAVGVALAIFILQLLLNFFWSIIFFRWHQPVAAFIEIVALWLAIAATLIAFSAIHIWSGILIVPYLAWVSFATYLNGAIWRLNRPALAG
jgi:benzodiazapine receptor